MQRNVAMSRVPFCINKGGFKIANNQGNFSEKMCNFVVSTVLADDLVTFILGARALAGTVMIKFKSRIYRTGN